MRAMVATSAASRGSCGLICKHLSKGSNKMLSLQTLLNLSIHFGHVLRAE